MTRLTAALLVGAFSLLGAVQLSAAEPPRDLKWAELMPPRTADKPKALKPFFASRGAAAAESTDNEPAPAYTPEGRWMSRPGKSRGGPPAVVSELDGQRVRIGGYIVPLDFEATDITEFLLVPFVGACIHVPPPPANQIIYVKAADGFKITEVFDPVYVTGKMQAKGAVTGLAEAGYTIQAEEIVMRKQ